MERRIIALERKYAAAMARIEKLETIVGKLTGNPYDQGEISLIEAQEACERGDKVTVQRYLDQYEKKTPKDQAVKSRPRGQRRP